MTNENSIDSYNGILAKISFENENGGRILSIYELDLIKQITFRDNKNSNDSYLNVGDLIPLSSGIFIVKNIFTKFLKETDSDYMKHGMTVYGEGEQLPFNLHIIYVVEKL